MLREVWQALNCLSIHASWMPFYRAMLCISAVYAVTRCPSVRSSVRPSRSWVAAKRLDIFEIFSPSGSQAILVFPYQTGWRYSDGNPANWGVECKGGIVGSKYMIYGPTSKKLQENVLWYFLVLLGPESNISKVGQNLAITKGLNVTSKKMAAVIVKMVNVFFGPVNRSRMKTWRLSTNISLYLTNGYSWMGTCSKTICNHRILFPSI